MADRIRRRITGAAAGFAAASLALQPGPAVARLAAAAPKPVRPVRPALGRVVVVGGGFGGATAARLLALGGQVSVTLVDREPDFVSCPMSNLVLAGVVPMSRITRSFDSLRRAGVNVLRGEAARVDVAARRLQLRDGSELPYDRLVLAPGVGFMWEQVPGLAEAVDAGRIVHAWKAGEQTVALRRQIDAMPDGGVFALSIPLAPYRCPPAPYERACLVADLLKRSKPRSKLIVLDANPQIQSKRALFERAFSQRYAGVIEYRPESPLLEVAGDVARFEFEDLKADVLNVIPPQRAGDIVRDAGLATVNGRWAEVDWLTMESTIAPGVHLLGDSVFPGPAMAKSGHMASQQGMLAAQAIARLLAGEPVTHARDLRSTCYSFVTPSLAARIASVHRYDARSRSFEPVPQEHPADDVESASEARDAWVWARRIWAESIG